MAKRSKKAARSRAPVSPRATQEPHKLSEWKHKKPLCNGKQTGRQCVHYFSIAHLEVTHVAPLSLKTIDDMSVRRDRYCTVSKHKEDRLVDAEGSDKMARYCSRYEPSKKKYDAAFEEAVVEAVNTLPCAPLPTAPTPEGLLNQVRAGDSPAAFPPPRDWDKEPDAPAGGYRHLEIDQNRTACGRGLPVLAEREGGLAEFIPLTTLHYPDVNCPGCMTEIQINPNIVGASRAIADVRGEQHG